MYGIRFMAVLALICTNALFAAEPSGKAVRNDDKTAYNDNVYYVINRKAGQDDSMARLPITGRMTALDAISQIDCGLWQVSDRKAWVASDRRIWLVRWDPQNVSRERILPIDWCDIAFMCNNKTNYLILPGDRIFIDDPSFSLCQILVKFTTPFERLAGIAGLTSPPPQSGSFPGRNYNQPSTVQ